MSFLKKLLPGRKKQKPLLTITEIPSPKRADHVRRFDFPPPEGFPVLFFEDVKITGVSYRRASVDAFITNHMISIEARTEEDNPKDPHAVALIGTWRDPGGVHSATLGYLPAAIAAQLATLDPPNFGLRLDALFLPRPGKSPGFRLSIWGKRGANIDPL